MIQSDENDDYGDHGTEEKTQLAQMKEDMYAKALDLDDVDLENPNSFVRKIRGRRFFFYPLMLVLHIKMLTVEYG